VDREAHRLLQLPGNAVIDPEQHRAPQVVIR
jgi:hypothetical protein